MKTNFSVKINLLFTVAALSLCATVNAQTTDNANVRRGNFGYSQNPKTKSKKEPEQQAKTETVTPQPTGIESNPTTENETIAKKTLEVVKSANRRAVAPTEQYRVGVGDVLLIKLQNNARTATFYTVLNDGSIDYPLAGELVQVSGLTPEEVQEALASRIKLYENPDVEVTVRDYASHKISVLGLVERAGERYLQREAMPLFVIRAEAMVKPEASRAVIRRADSKVETFSLSDESAQGVLIFPGDIVEFTTDRTVVVGNGKFFYIGGEIASVGRKDFYEGLTLTQAIVESGGLKKDNVKRVIIRRKNQEGLLVSTEYNLKQIKDGKTPDPSLAIGDIIEVGN